MNITVGIDEAGRGCWAGPLVASAVILDHETITGITDSKKISAKRRTELAEIIQQRAVAVGVGIVTNDEVDRVGLTAAVRLAMTRSMEKISVNYDQIIIDGNYNFLSDNPKSTTLIKADSVIPCVGAASIVAKTARDRIMHEAASEFPEYGFDSHVGYGTKNHLEKLQLHGPCRLHRLSYKPLQTLVRTNNV